MKKQIFTAVLHEMDDYPRKNGNYFILRIYTETGEVTRQALPFTMGYGWNVETYPDGTHSDQRHAIDFSDSVYNYFWMEGAVYEKLY